MKLELPLGLQDAAKTLGVHVDSHADIDPTEGIAHLTDQFGSDAFGEDFHLAVADYGDTFEAFGADVLDSFGFSLKNPFKMFKAVHKKSVQKLAAKFPPAQRPAVLKLARAPVHVDIKRSITGLGKGIATGVSMASFVVPGVGPLVGGAGLAALGAADKVLSDPRVKNAASIIKTTQGMAALGNIPAQRGAATLAAAAQIRTALKVPPGKPAIPLQTNAQRAAVAAVIPKTVAHVTPAVVKKAATAAVKKPPGWWDKVLKFFHMQRAA